MTSEFNIAPADATPVTPITDEALARLNNALDTYRQRVPADHRTSIRLDVLLGILARLEAAERDRNTWYEVCKTLSKTPPDPPLWLRSSETETKGT